jgi:hypothetical protein
VAVLLFELQSSGSFVVGRREWQGRKLKIKEAGHKKCQVALRIK